MHKTGNVLNYAPKSVQPKMKDCLHDIWRAATREDAEKAFVLFEKLFEPKYPKAVQCLQKDREELMAFYDFPAQHWQSLRTTNPIESTFGTIPSSNQAIQGLYEPRWGATYDLQAGHAPRKTGEDSEDLTTWSRLSRALDSKMEKR